MREGILQGISRRRTLFWVLWAGTTVFAGWQIWAGNHSFDSPLTLPALLLLLFCTAALLWWLAASAPGVPSQRTTTRRGVLFLLVIVAAFFFFALRDLVGPPLLFGLPLLALVVLVLLRPRLSWRQVGYALLLALIAGVAGLGAGWVTIAPPVWAGLQVALVLTGLLAGWAMLQHGGLWPAGMGRSLWLAEGPRPALHAFGRGLLLAMPWALGMILLGSADGEGWVSRWWQPFLAIQPGIAEEAWGRVLLVPALFLLFRRVARGRVALHVAVVLLAYWFAYLHTSGGLEAAVSTLLIGTLVTLPVSYLWLWEGLETAIGFHFWLDFVKFVMAYLLNRGLWP